MGQLGPTEIKLVQMGQNGLKWFQNRLEWHKWVQMVYWAQMAYWAKIETNESEFITKHKVSRRIGPSLQKHGYE